MADKKLDLRVIAPTTATDKSPYKYRKDVDMVILRCTTGDMGILPGRLPCSMVLDLGVLRIYEGADEHHMAVMGGVAHVSNNRVTILSESAEWSEEIRVDEVNAKMQNFQRLHDETSSLSEKDAYKVDLRRCKIQLEVAKGK